MAICAFYGGIGGAWVFFAASKYEVLGTDSFDRTDVFNNAIYTDINSIWDYFWYEGGSFDENSACYKALIADITTTVDNEASAAINLVAQRDELAKSCPGGSVYITKDGAVTITFTADGRTLTETYTSLTDYHNSTFYKSLSSGTVITDRAAGSDDVTAPAVGNAAINSWTEKYLGVCASLSDYSSRPLIVDAEEVMAEVEASHRSEYAQAMATLRTEYGKTEEAIMGMSSLKFLVRDNSTGYIYTNTDLTSADAASVQQFTQGSSWSWSYTQKGGFSSAIGPDSVDLPAEQTDNRNSVADLVTSKFKSANCDIYISIVPSGKTSDNYATLIQNYERCKRFVKLWCILVFAALAFCTSMTIFLTVTAGIRSDGSRFTVFIDKLPGDVHLLLSGAAIWAVVFFGGKMTDLPSVASLGSSASGLYIQALTTGACVTLIFLILTELFISAARTARAGSFWHRTLIFTLGVLLAKFIRHIGSSVPALFGKGFQKVRGEALSFVLLLVLINAAAAALCAICAVRGQKFLSIVFAVSGAVADIACFVYGYRFLKALDDVMVVAHGMKSGNYDTDIATDEVPDVLREFTDDILNSRDGLKTALNEAVKGERMKSELITNVSHDLKTPLTSIIAYSDLLTKLDIGDETAKQYISIISDKAYRIKKLIEDLTEVSKISSGNIKLEIVKVDLYELAVQVTGEFEDELGAMGIEIRLADSPAPVMVMADSQQTWRVIDNLMSNIRKYAMHDTRVYASVTTDNSYGVFIIKNVSKTELNVPTEKLTERFVMGDSSRKGGDSSGLGLSIAKSLCELQNGSFSIGADGDIFIATVKLPLAPDTGADKLPDDRLRSTAETVDTGTAADLGSGAAKPQDMA